MMGMCPKCGKMMGITFLVLGILFLLKDWNIWNFWGISAWSAFFVMIGMALWGKSCCPECQAMNGMSMKKK